MNWSNIKDLRYDGYYYIFTDDKGKEARMDKEAVIVCVAGWKSEQEGV